MTILEKAKPERLTRANANTNNEDDYSSLSAASVKLRATDEPS
jgi:hypothetical protein